MREIKFRAWWKYGKECIYIKDLYFFEENGIHSIPDAEYEIEQFTGLHDKNGKEIYEGDIIDISGYPEDSPSPVYIVFEDGAFKIKYQNWDSSLSKPLINISLIKLLGYIIIGNIHENPELLESER